MSRHAAPTVFALVVAALLAAAPSAAAAELIVRFEPGASAGERAAIRADAGTDFEASLPLRGMQIVQVEPGQSARAAERALELADGVAYAEPNFVRRAFQIPDDPYFDLLWGLHNTGQPIRQVAGDPDADVDAVEAWDRGSGGDGVMVAVVDTGVDRDHPDLAASAWSNPGESGGGRESNGVDDDANGRVDDWRGWDFVAGDTDPADENGHGTHVAGTIAARRGNALGVAGVASGARVMALRVLDAGGSGRVSHVIAANAYAARAGARVVNLSLGSASYSRAEYDVMAAFPDVLFVAAAGNGGDDGVGDDNDVTPEYPCAYDLPNVVCVAATDNADRLAAFSNFGARSVDLAAPGVSIASTWPGGGYGWSSGTSMATPHVAGAAALLWMAAPDTSAAEARMALLAGTDATQALTDRVATGGRLNADRSLQMVAGAALAEPAPAPAPALPAPGAAAPQPEPPAGPAPVPPAVGDAVAPRLSVRVGRRQPLRAIARRGIAARVRCSERCLVRARLVRGRLVLASASERWSEASAPALLAARPTRRGRSSLRSASAARAAAGRGAPLRARLVVRATDRSGNTRTVTSGVLLTR